MYRFLLITGYVFLSPPVFSQRIVTIGEAVNLSLQNKINLSASALEVQQQNLLYKATAVFNNPDVDLEQSPYEGLLIGIQQRLNLPAVYASQKALQREKIQLSLLMQQLNQNDIKRLTKSNYLQIQYLTARVQLLTSQDSLYQSIKIAANRNFAAGQINKLQELFAAKEADKIGNELSRASIDLHAQEIAFSYITGYNKPFKVEPLRTTFIDNVAIISADTSLNTTQQQIFMQQVNIAQQQLKVQRAELLPSFTAGPLFPLSRDYKTAVGFRVGVSVPIWAGRNKARINAAKTSVLLAEAQRQNASRNYLQEYQLTYANLLKEKSSLVYFNSIALQQSREMSETALRLFDAGQTDYTELLRIIISAFETRITYLETLKNYHQAFINLNYLTGNL